jgi:hypothetical protein
MLQSRKIVVRLAIALAFAVLFGARAGVASDVTVQGTNGMNGPSGFDGGAGTPGWSATGTNIGSPEINNTAYAIGGIGGSGGDSTDYNGTPGPDAMTRPSTSARCSTAPSSTRP